MSEWDDSLVSFEAPPDGRILSAVGGASGNMRLVNGQKITFPFKAQEEIPDSVPPGISTIEVEGATHYLYSTYTGGRFPTVMTSAPFLRFISDFPDSASQGALIDISSGNPVAAGDGEALIRLSTVGTNGSISVFGDVTMVNSLNVGSVAATTALTISTTEDLTISTAGAGDTIVIDSADTLTLNSAGLLTIQPDANVNLALTTTGTGDVNITAGDDVNITSGGGIVLQTGSGVNLDITAVGLGNLNLAGSTVFINTIDLSTPLGAWTTHTPTVTQSGSVTKTTTYSKAVKLGRTVIWSFLLNITGSGTGGSTVTLSLPYTAAQAGNMTVGAATLYNGATNVQGEWAINATTTIAMYQSGGFYTVALASGNAITGTIVYEAAS